jgi:uncharacterized protein (TIGR03067 family)
MTNAGFEAGWWILSKRAFCKPRRNGDLSMPSRTVLLSVALFLPTTVLSYGQDAKRTDADKTDADKVQGKWQISEFVAAGKNIGVAGRLMTFAGNSMTLELRTAGNGPRKYTFKLDEKTKPKTIDLTELDGPFKDNTILGIYRFDGVDLVLCIPNRPSKERIMDFDLKEGSTNVLIKLKREPK